MDGSRLPVGTIGRARGLAFVKYGDQAASTRQRLLQFDPYFRAEGIDMSVLTLLSNTDLRQLYATGKRSKMGVARAYADRLHRIRRSGEAEVLWVYCELFPYLPGWVERAARLSGAPVIYDFDDAIFHQYDTHPNPLVRRLLGRKLEPLLRGAHLAVCGNAYLRDYAARFCRRTEIVPTVVDTELYRPGGSKGEREVTIGWIGSPSTWRYLRSILPMLEEAAAEHDLRISVVGAGPKAEAGPRIRYHEWSEEREIAMIQDMDIGIMPLPDEPWARGKCGYKLIQYMACGLPVIASPIGVNAEIVEHGVNGFLARSASEWAEAIGRLAAAPDLRARMGAEGRARIERRYSLHVHGPRLARLVREVIDDARA